MTGLTPSDLQAQTVCDYMKVIETTKRCGPAAGFETRRKVTIMNIARSFNNWRKYRQTIAELGRMTTRKLHDLGIDRCDIRSVARTAVAR